jgi:hypothetical protein
MKTFLGLTGALVLTAAGLQAPAEAADTPDVVLDAAVETFHYSPTDLCPEERVNIDGPVRAFEDQNHVIHLTTATPRGRAYQWTGSVTGFTNNPRTAVLDCVAMMESFDEANPVPDADIDLFDQKTFLQALYFRDGTVHGYGHEDYYGTRLDPPPAGCDDHTDPDDNGRMCWYSAIALWSADVPASGTHLVFRRSGTPPNHIAIYPRITYPGHDKTAYAGWIGPGAPSNIVRGRTNGVLDGYSYMFVYTSAGDTGQDKGVCLFRSETPWIRTSWYGWTGTAFTQQLKNPYDPETANVQCHVVEPGMFQQPVRSVVYHKPSGHYIAFYRAADGVRYATSTDLVNWNASFLLVPGDTDVVNYQSVIDFDGGDFGDDNFDRLYDNGKAYLFYRRTVAGGHSELLRQKLSIGNFGPDQPSAG